MKLLLLEDDRKTAAYLQKGLSELGLVVHVSHDGDEGLRLASRVAYDLIVLDVQLPGRDGWSVVQELRRSGNQSGVLLCSALGSISDRVKGLRLGADDYLVKPFAFTELVARIESILRRPRALQSEVVRISDLEIEPPRRRATRGGKRLDLTPREFQLLSLLARRPGEPFSRTVIAEQIWDMGCDNHNRIEVHIRRLRSKVDDPFDKSLIHTVRGYGYVLEDR